MKRSQKLSQQPPKAVIAGLVNEVNLYVLLATEKMTKKTGLSAEFCRPLIIKDLAKRKGLA